MNTGIICISDLHIEKGDSLKELEWVNHFCDFLNRNPKEKLIIFVLGDIISNGNFVAYEDAEKVIKKIRKKLSVTKCEFVFLPGNHDYCSGNINAFKKFSKNSSSFIFLFEKSNIENISIENINFILIDTIHNGNYSLPGYVDLNKLESYVQKNKENIILMHHAILNDDGNEHSGIQNNSEFIKFLIDNNIRYVIHGHEHFNVNTEGLNDIFCFGCGSINSKCAEDLTNEDETFLNIIADNTNINQIIKYQYHSGSNQYEDTLIYPQIKNKYRNILEIEKKKYSNPGGYIDRKLVVNDNDISYYLFNDAYEETSENALEENKRIIILADATLGKTIELEHMAYILSEKTNKYPVLIKLHCYNNETIEELILNEAPMYSSVDFNFITLIFDGFDELSDENYFTKELAKYMDKFDSNICISMRSNFYKDLTIFEKFKIYKLLDLNSEQVSSILELKGIDKKEFVDIEGINKLLRNPFYLPYIIELYTKENRIKNKNQIIEYLIKKNIHVDKKKFEYKIEIENNNENKVIKSCTKFALCLAILEVNELDFEKYCMYISTKDRTLINQCFLVTKTVDNSFLFSHNIYKEYLIAKHLINLEPALVKELVTINNNKNEINEAWFNTLDLMLKMDNCNKEIYKWVKQICPILIIKSEQFVSSKDKYEIIKGQVDEIKNSNMWYNEALCEKSILGKGCECKETLNFIIENLNISSKDKVIDFCVGVLSGFINIDSRKTEISHTLKKLLKSEILSNIKKNILICMAKLNISSEEDEQYLVDNYIKSKDPYIRNGMLNYLSYIHKLDEHIEIVVNTIESYIVDYSKNDYAISEILNLKNKICEINSKESLVFIITAWSETIKTDYIDSKILNDILNEVLKQTYKVFDKYDDELYISCFKLFRNFSKNYYDESSTIMIKYFDKVHLLEKVVCDLLKEEDQEICTIIFSIAKYDNSIVRIICREYRNNSINTKNIIENLAYLYRNNSVVFNELNKLYIEKNGDKIQIQETVNYSELNKKDAQNYFKALSNISNLSLLVDKLLKYYKNDELTYAELVENSDHGYKNIDGINHLIHAIVRCNLDDSFKIRNFIEYINGKFDYFQFYELSHLVNRREIIIDDSTKKLITNKALNYLENLDLHKAYVEKENRNTIDILIYESINILRKLDYLIPINTIYGIIEVPYTFLGYKNIDEKYENIINRIGKNKLIDKIKELIIKENRLALISEYYSILNKYGIEGYKEKAIEICLNDEYKIERKDEIVFYLINIYGVDEYIEKVANKCENRTLVDLIYRVNEEDNRALTNEIIKRYDNDKLPEFTRYLVKRNNYHALKYLYKKFKKQNGVLKEDSTNDLTIVIREVSNPRLLPLLAKLTILCNKNNFIDAEILSIKYELEEAYINCSKNNFKLTKMYLKILRSYFKYKKQDNSVAYCNYYLKSIYENQKIEHSYDYIIKHLNYIK